MHRCEHSAGGTTTWLTPTGWSSRWRAWHTGDSLSFLLVAENALLTGDTVLGHGTSVVAWPDGELAAYLVSLQRIETMTGSREVTQILPGHGPTVPDVVGVVRHYIDHRQLRLEQVRAAVAAGSADADA